MLFIRNNKSNPSASITYNKDRKRRPNLSVLSLEFLESRVNPTAIVSTDLLDYAPGSTALITANNFMPGADVTFQVQHVLAGADDVFGTADDIPDTILNSKGSGHEPWTVKDGGAGDLDGLANGAITTSWYVNPDDSAGATFVLTASGLSPSGVVETASTIFTDSVNQLWAWRNQGGDANSWTTNTVQSSNAIFADNDAIPFRWTSTATGGEHGNDLREGTVYTVRLEWTFSGGTNDPSQLFIDYLTSYNATESATGPFPASFTGGSNSTISIPTDPDPLVKGQTAGLFNLYNIDSKTLKFTSGSASDRYVEVAINKNESHKYIDIQFTPDDGDGTPNEKVNVGIAWGGHLASETLYGINNGASNFPGASTTMSVDLDPSSKGDVSTLSINTNSAIVPQGSITIVKDSLPNSLQDFTFMASSSVLSTIPASFTLDDDSGVAGADSTYSNSAVFFGLTAGTYTFTENSVSGWTLSSLTATENGASDTTASDIFTSNLGTRTLTITLADGEVWTGTFTNTVIANSPPVVTTSLGVTAFIEGNNVTSIPIVVDAAVTVTDSDNATLSSGSVSITANFQASEDILAFTNVPGTMGNIVGIYNAGTGVLSLSSAGATATLAQWQAAFRSITYTNSSNTPNTSTRTVSFRVNDGTNNSNLATKQVSIAAVNDTPIAVNDSYTTSEDTLLSVATLGVLGNDTDADGDPLTSILVSGPSNGLLSLNANGSFSYTPNANYNGSDSFTYKANDGSADSNTATVNITITPVNDPPVSDPSAAADAYTTLEDTVLNVPAPGLLANDTDVDGDALTSILVSGPSNGSLTFNADGSFSYTPNLNYNGPDSFTYKANDGSLDSAAILVSLTITPVNDPPVSDPSAAADAYTTLEDTVLNVAAPGVLANDTDVDGDALTSILVSGPSHGSLIFNADGSFSYTPNANYNGPDSFTYKANDGSLDSAPILVSLTITAVNDAPVSDPSAAADAYTTLEDTVLNVAAPGVLANDIDVDGDALTSILVSGPSNGSLTFNADGSFSYTPNVNYNGPDSFTYKANDGSLDSAPILVSLTITAVNNPPVSDPSAAADAYTTLEDTVLNVAAPGVLANDTDVDGDALTSILVSGPSNGLLSFNADGSFSYTPNVNYNGPDSFTYKANDGLLDSAPILVSLTITAVNDAPVSDPSAAADAYTTLEDTVLNVAAPGVLANDTDVDGDALTSILVSGPSNGSLTFNADGSFSYTPNANYNGPDSFTYKANDGSLDSAPILVSLTITAVNNPPVSDPSAAADAYTTLEDTVLNVAAPGVLANDTDVDGDALTSILVSGPSNGSLTFNADGSFSYTPNANYNGADSFTYKANDGSLDSAPILVSLTITAVNDAPVSDPSAAADAYTTLEDTVLNVAAPGVLANDTDVDGDPLTSILVSGPSNGSLSFNADGSFSYTPNANYNGPDSFTYKANDGSLDSAPILVSLTITAVNDAPVSLNDSYSTNEEVILSVPTLGVLGNDTDTDGKPLNSILVNGPSHGSLSLNANGSFSYTPNANYNGPDSFTYKANNGSLNGNIATVNITITPVNDAPVSDPSAAADAYTTAEDTVLNVAAPGVLANDTDVNGDPLTSILVSGPSNGSLTFNPDGSFSYTPNVNYNGPDSFTYKANDGSLDSAPILVSLTITAVNDAPVSDPSAAADAYTTAEDTVLNVAAPGVLANDIDVDGDPLTSILVSGPSNGSLTFNPDGSFSYTPNVNYNGPDSFTYKANDGSLDSAAILVSITVNPGNKNYLTTGISIGADPLAAPTETFVQKPGIIPPEKAVLSFPGFSGEVSVAQADFNGDGIIDIVVGAGLGGGPHIRVINGATEQDFGSFFAFDPSFRGGVFVAASDINGDGFADIVVGAGPGGGPHVKVFDGQTFAEIKSFFAYDPSFRGGVSVAAYDFNKDGFNEIVTGAGAGGAPHVKVFDGQSLQVIKEFMAYALTFGGGVYVAAGDFDSDLVPDIITGAGAGGGPHVIDWEYDTLKVLDSTMAFDKFTQPDGTVIDQLFAGGVRVGIAYGSDDNKEDLIVGAGPGGGPHVKVYSKGNSLDQELSYFAGDSINSDGIFVG